MSGTIAFYDPSVKAPFDPYERGTTLRDVLAWDDRTLEYRHDFIQHLFPLPERSPVNPDAPVITKEVRDAFVQRDELCGGLQKAWTRMSAFYGFDTNTSEGEPRVTKSANFWSRAPDSWLVSRDHNHQRITRILRSLRILDLESEAQALYRGLVDADKEAGNPVSRTSISFWTRAAKNPLAQPPDDRHPEVSWLRS